MLHISFDISKNVGVVKPMHCTNNGPANNRAGGNGKWFQAAGIPYARNHDASFSSSYGGEHTVDVHLIFRDFDADENDPDSYDFTLTDQYVQRTLDFGTVTYYRLGSKIEHEIKKYGTKVPKDYGKWARICEHIIAHYTAGWANGFTYDMPYWEIWNEFDCGWEKEAGSRPCWQGTKEEFFDFYATVATQLKTRFPHLKIGGPALTSIATQGMKAFWYRDFIQYMSEHRVPLDFFSFHIYAFDPQKFVNRIKLAREALDEFGYTNAEIHLNEWNYVYSWKAEDFYKNYQTIPSVKGAAFVSAVQIACQNAPLDVLMYYDARPNTAWNGMFAPYTLDPLKPYYSFFAYNCLYRCQNQIESKSDSDSLYALGASDDDRIELLFSYFHDLGVSPNQVEVEIDRIPDGIWTVDCKILNEKFNLETVKSETALSPSHRLQLQLDDYCVYQITLSKTKQ